MCSCIGSRKMVLFSKHDRCVVNAYCFTEENIGKLKCDIGTMVLREKLEEILCLQAYDGVFEYILCPRCSLELDFSYKDLISCVFDIKQKALSARVCDYSDDEREDVQ